VVKVSADTPSFMHCAWSPEPVARDGGEVKEDEE